MPLASIHGLVSGAFSPFESTFDLMLLLPFFGGKGEEGENRKSEERETGEGRKKRKRGRKEEREEKKKGGESEIDEKEEEKLKQLEGVRRETVCGKLERLGNQLKEPKKGEELIMNAQKKGENLEQFFLSLGS